jgi:hypothetical protein
MLCHDCGSTIEEGRKDAAPVLARFCLKCRSERRRRQNLKYAWLPQHDAYLARIITAASISVVASFENWRARPVFRAGTSNAGRDV